MSFIFVHLKRFCIAITALALATLSYGLCKNALAFYHAEQTYHVVAEKLAALTFSVERLQKAEGATVQQRILLQELVEKLQKYQISLPKDLRQLTPALFQDYLRHDVSELKEKAIEAPISLPEDFFLGLNQYENIPPTPQELEKAIEQEILLYHIVTKILEHPRLKLEQFELQENSERKKSASNPPSSYTVPLGTLLINFTTDERAFQKLFNDIVESPYLYIIESMSVENSNQTPPPHETLTHNAEPLTNSVSLISKYPVNPSVECASTNHQSFSKCVSSSTSLLPSSISHLPSPAAVAASPTYNLQPTASIRPVGRIVTPMKLLLGNEQLTVTMRLQLFNFALPLGETIKNLSSQSPSAKKATLAPVLEPVNHELRWISPSNDIFSEPPLFTSRHYFLHQGKLIDPIEAKIQLHPPVPNEWLLKNHLDITDPDILSRDNDHDGFTNLEEWRGSNPYTAPGTESSDPNHPESHPLLWTKLSYHSTDLHQQTCSFDFTGYEMENGEQVFQLQPHSPIPNVTTQGRPHLDTKTRYARLGETLQGIPLKPLAFQKQETLHKEVPYDTSTLTLVNPQTQQEWTLTRKSLLHPEPTSITITDDVTLHYNLENPSQELHLKRNDSFSLKNNTHAGEQHTETYRLIDIQNSQIILEHEGKIYILPVLEEKEGRN